MQGWTAGFAAEQPDVTVNYDPVGSGGGREQFLAGGTDFAGSDAALDDEELAAAAGALRRRRRLRAARTTSPPSPSSSTSRASTSCNLSPDDARAASSPARSPPGTTRPSPRTTRTRRCPTTAITPVHRADESGTTENFTDYLAQAAGDVWTVRARRRVAARRWRGRQRHLRRRRRRRRPATARSATPTSARPATSASPNIRVGEEFVAPSPEAAAAVVENSEPQSRAAASTTSPSRSTATTDRVRRVPDRPGQLPHRLRRLRRRRRRPTCVAGLPGLRDQRGRPAGRRRRRRQRPDLGHPARAGADRGRRHHRRQLTAPGARRPGTSHDARAVAHASATAHPHHSTIDPHGAPVTATKPRPEPPQPSRRPRPGDRIFAGSAKGAGILHPGRPRRGRRLPGHRGPARRSPLPPRTSPAARALAAYVGPLVFGTLLAAVIALLVATPLAVAIALFITYYAPRRLAAEPGLPRSTCWPRSPASSTASGASGWLAPALVPFYALGRGQPRLHPALRRPGVGHRPHDAHRRPGAGGHDPADHLAPSPARSSARRRPCTARRRSPWAPPAGR